VVSNVPPETLSPEQKLLCVLRVLRGEWTMPDAAAAYGVAAESVVAWRQSVLAASLMALGQPAAATLVSRIDALLDAGKAARPE